MLILYLFTMLIIYLSSKKCYFFFYTLQSIITGTQQSSATQTIEYINKHRHKNDIFILRGWIEVNQDNEKEQLNSLIGKMNAQQALSGNRLRNMLTLNFLTIGQHRQLPQTLAFKMGEVTPQSYKLAFIFYLKRENYGKAQEKEKIAPVFVKEPPTLDEQKTYQDDDISSVSMSDNDNLDEGQLDDRQIPKKQNYSNQQDPIASTLASVQPGSSVIQQQLQQQMQISKPIATQQQQQQSFSLLIDQLKPQQQQQPPS